MAEEARDRRAGHDEAGALKQGAAPVPAGAGVTTRAVVLGLLLVPLNCWWMAVMEVRWNSLDTTCVSLFFHVVFLLLVLTGLNALVARRYPRLALRQAELLTLYVMLSIASAVMGRDSLENLPSVLAYPRWFNNPTNQLDRFFAFIPKWMAPADREALRGYYNGSGTLYTPRVLAAWLVPSLFWAGFIVLLVWMMLCINAILRRRWVEHEKLAFPLVQVPVSITDGATYRQRMLWLGFAIPFIIQSLDNLNYFYPSVPALNLKLRDWGPLFTTPPWNGIGWLPVGFFPFAIGFAFFLPLDLTFSCWFFYLARKLFMVACVAWGWRDPGLNESAAKFPFFAEQGTGAWVGLSVALVWLSRRYLWDVLKQAAGLRRRAQASAAETGDDAHAGMSYRTAVLGLLLGMVALAAVCRAAGMSLWLPFVYFAFYFVLSVGITRVRAELGPPAHELNWVNPERVMVTVFGTQTLGLQNLTLLSFFFWFNRGYRSHPMPHGMEALKMGQTARMDARRLTVAMMLAAALGAVAAIWALLDVFYRYGEATPRVMAYTTGIGVEAFGRLQDWADNPRPPAGTAIGFMGVGAAITLLLAAAKSRFFWWPFHPIGFALANSYALEYFWSSLFIGWVLKSLITRYGGVRQYRSARPFFLGLILGDYVVAALWSLIGSVLGVSTYRTFIF